MLKAYIIIKGSGEYSDRITEPVRVYLDRASAQSDMQKLEEIAKKGDEINQPKGRWCYDAEKAESLGPAIEQAYAEIGYEATWRDDWQLAEAELEEHPISQNESKNHKRAANPD